MQELLALAMRGTFFAGTRVRTQNSPGTNFLPQEPGLHFLTTLTLRLLEYLDYIIYAAHPQIMISISIFRRSPFSLFFFFFTIHGMHSLSSDLHFTLRKVS